MCAPWTEIAGPVAAAVITLALEHLFRRFHKPRRAGQPKLQPIYGPRGQVLRRVVSEESCDER